MKYLCQDCSKYFLTDVCRPIQYVYSFDDSCIYLVDLDPLYEEIISKDGNINERFLVGLNTLNAVRNRYYNKGIRSGIIEKDWGERSRNVIKKVITDTDFLSRSKYSDSSSRIVNNLVKGITYR